MHTSVYTCTHCGRKGHLVKFCFDRINHLNFANKNIWVSYNTKPHGPKKKIWVPKSLPLMFYVGLSQDVRELVSWWWMHLELDGYT